MNEKLKKSVFASPSGSQTLLVFLTVTGLFVAAGILRSSVAEGLMNAQLVRAVPSLNVDVLRKFPHDPEAYTQGLLWWEGKLYESTGQYGRSDLRRVDPQTGDVERIAQISPAYFGEGLARIEERLVMLTWKAQRALVHDLESFNQLATLRYRGEGWGLCNDGRRLVMSDGSDQLTFRSLESFEITGRVSVTLQGQPLTQLNELECVGGSVYANVYQTEVLVRIDPGSGRVTQTIDASGLLTRSEARGVDVLNGIAYDPAAKTFYITGKLWPLMFEVRFSK